MYVLFFIKNVHVCIRYLFYVPLCIDFLNKIDEMSFKVLFITLMYTDIT